VATPLIGTRQKLDKKVNIILVYDQPAKLLALKSS